MPAELKGKVYNTLLRPAMLHGTETLATTKRQEKRIEVNETRMVRWMHGMTRKDNLTIGPNRAKDVCVCGNRLG